MVRNDAHKLQRCLSAIYTCRWELLRLFSDSQMNKLLWASMAMQNCGLSMNDKDLNPVYKSN